MKIKTNLFFGLILLGMTFSVLSVKAQSAQTFSANNQGSEADLASAKVSIDGKKFSTIENGKMKVSFILTASGRAISGAKYSLSLSKSDGKVTQILDEKVFEETFNLASGEQKTIETTYEPPKYLKGTYRLWLDVKDEKNRSLGATIFKGNIVLNGSGEYLEINPQKVYVTVKDDPSAKDYAASFGVDIDKNEDLVFNAEFTNYFKKDVVVYPSFTTYFRSVFGRVIGSQKSDQAVSFKSGEKKLINIVVPKAEKPQAYEVRMDLVDASGQNVSSPVYFHYVLKGNSATIQSLSLDKDYYQKGEIANLDVMWTGQVNAFIGSRKGLLQNSEDYSVEAIIKDGKNSNCSKKFERSINEREDGLMFSETVGLPISSNCLDPEATVQIKAKNGEILDSQTFKVVSKNRSNPEGSVINNPSNDGQNGNILLKILGVLAIIFIISMVALIVKKRKSGSISTLIFAFALASALFSFAGGAKACGSGSYCQDWDASIEGDKKSIFFDIEIGGTVGIVDEPKAEEAMELYSIVNVSQWICNNSSANVGIKIFWKIEEQTETGEYIPFHPGGTLYDDVVEIGKSIDNKRATWPVFDTPPPGNYKVVFTIVSSVQRDWIPGKDCYDHCSSHKDGSDCQFIKDEKGEFDFGTKYYISNYFVCDNLDPFSGDTNQTCGCPALNKTMTTYKEVNFTILPLPEKEQVPVTVNIKGDGYVSFVYTGHLINGNGDSVTETALLNKGEPVLLSAAANSGATFQKWEGDCSGVDNNCSLGNIDSAKNVTAVFTGGADPLYSCKAKTTADICTMANCGTFITKKKYVCENATGTEDPLEVKCGSCPADETEMCGSCPSPSGGPVTNQSNRWVEVAP